MNICGTFSPTGIKLLKTSLEKLEVTQVNQTKVWIFLRLPCTNMDNWFLGVVEVNHKEEVTGIAIA